MEKQINMVLKILRPNFTDKKEKLLENGIKEFISSF